MLQACRFAALAQGSLASLSRYRCVLTAGICWVLLINPLAAAEDRVPVEWSEGELHTEPAAASAPASARTSTPVSVSASISTSTSTTDSDGTVTELSMPFNPDDPNDTQFLNQLLLSHGLELQIPTGRTVGHAQFNTLVQSINQGGYQHAAAQGLVNDISQSVFLSFWSGSEEIEPSNEFLPPVPTDWKIRWWDVDRLESAVNDESRWPDSTGTAPIQTTRGVRSRAMNQLIERLADDGYELSVETLCAVSNRVEKSVARWLAQGQLPADLPSSALQEFEQLSDAPFTETSAHWLNVFENGVSRQWRVIWLDCADGLALVRLPPLTNQDLNRVTPSNNNALTPQPQIPDRELQQTPSATPGPAIAGSLMPPAIETLPEAVPTSGSTPGSTQGSTANQAIGLPVLPPLESAPSIVPQSPAPESAGGNVQINDDVPEGFEALAGPQFVYIDVYFNDELLGSTGITATADEFTFDDPAEVVQLLQDDVDNNDLINWLSESLATNGHLACFAEEDPPGCGRVEADPVAAIYNEILLRVDLFFSAKNQALQFRDVQRHLPDPESDNTAILSVYALASKLAGESSSVDVSGRALYGYGRGHVTAEADYNDRLDRQRLREFKLTHYLNEHEVVAGTYSFHPGGALTDIDLMGAGFGTTFKTRVDLEHAFSSQLVVYLSTRAVVQLVIDGRVYSGDSYAAGNQVLNTSDLPDGTYDVELRIFDQAGTFRSERRLFTKSTRIPPQGETVYAVTAGQVLQPDSDGVFPELSDTSVLGMSMSRRLNDQSAWRSGLLQFGSHSLVQGEYLYLGQRVSFQATGSVGQSNTIAAGIQTGFSVESMSFSLAANHFSSGIDPENDSVEAAFFGPDYDQLSFSANRSFGQIAVGARTSFRREQSTEGETDTTEQYGIFAQRPIYRRAHSRGLVSTSFLRTPDDSRVELKFDWFFDKNQFNGSLGFQSIDTRLSENQWQGDASLGWRSLNSRTTDFKTGAYATAAQSSTAYGVRAEVQHPWFLATAASDINAPEGGASLQNSVVSLSAHLGVDRRGIGMGGSDFAQAGVIVNVSGEPDGELFDILINNSRVSTGSIGTKQFIGLQPFRTYEIKFVPHSLLGNGLADDRYEFTVFPGTVHRIDMQARREVLLIATLVDDKGNLLVDALLKTERNALLVDRDGILQAEVHAGEWLTIRKNDSSTCQIQVPQSDDEDVIIPDEPMVCQ